MFTHRLWLHLETETLTEWVFIGCPPWDLLFALRILLFHFSHVRDLAWVESNFLGMRNLIRHFLPLIIWAENSLWAWSTLTWSLMVSNDFTLLALISSFWASLFPNLSHFLSSAPHPQLSFATLVQCRFLFASLYLHTLAAPSQSLYLFPLTDWVPAHICLCILRSPGRSDRSHHVSQWSRHFNARFSQGALHAGGTNCVRFLNAWRWGHLGFFAFSVRFQFSDVIRHRRGAQYVSNAWYLAAWNPSYAQVS